MQGFDLEEKSVRSWSHMESFPSEDGKGQGKREHPDLRASRAQGHSSCVLYPEAMRSECMGVVWTLFLHKWPPHPSLWLPWEIL